MMTVAASVLGFSRAIEPASGPVGLQSKPVIGHIDIDDQAIGMAEGSAVRRGSTGDNVGN